MNTKRILAIDVGGTSIKSAIVNGREALDFKDTSTPHNINAFLETLKLIISHYTANHQFDHVGMSLPGLIDYRKQVALVCPNLPYLNNFSPKILDGNIKMANDADLALAGEMYLSGFTGDCAIFTLGTGVGGAISIAGKKPFEMEMSGEFGHIKITPDGPKCACGQIGCVESHISARAILDQAQAKISGQIDNVEELFSLARQSNPKAVEIVQGFSNHLAMAIANVVNITGISSIILSGKISKSSDVFMDLLKPQLLEKIAFSQYRDIKITTALDAEKSALFGTIALFE